MNKLNIFNHRINLLFQGHITGNLTVRDLINGLKEIEATIKKSIDGDGSLWFKFSTDDTLATTIEDLEKDLSDGNRELTLERIKESLILENEFHIFYS